MDAPLPVQPDQLLPFGESQGRDEMNWAEFSPTLLTNTPPTQTTFERECRVYDPRRKEWITGALIIRTSPGYGLPTASDNRVMLGLIQLTKEKTTFLKPSVPFTLRELLDLLAWSPTGTNYDRLEKSLKRLALIKYEYHKIWWDNRQKAFCTRIFSVLDDLKIFDGRTRDEKGELCQSNFVWGNAIFESFQAGYLRAINFELCVRLKQPVALQLYRLLSKRSWVRGPEVEFPLLELLHSYLGVVEKAYGDKGQMARFLRKGIEELVEVGFLADMPENERYVKNGKQWSIRFVLTEQAMREISPPPLPSVAAAPAVNPLIEVLALRGVSRSTAHELVGAHPAEQIGLKVEVFDWLKTRDDKHIKKNPAGYLVQSIRKDYAPPKGFESKAAREEREKKEAADRRAAQEQKRRQAEAEAREKAEQEARQARIDAYWNSLDSAQQAALMEAALEADPEGCQSLESMRRGGMKPFARQIEKGVRDRHIAKLLGEPAPA